MSMITGESLVLGLTAPSGAGKSFMTDAILQEWPEFRRPVVATTRLPRDGEVEDHRAFMSAEEFSEAVASGAVVLPHRPFCDDHTPEYGFVSETISRDKPLLTEVHSSIIVPFREMLAGRKVLLIGMFASGQTLEGNMLNRQGSETDDIAYRTDSAAIESRQINDALEGGHIDMVVDYEPASRATSESRVMDLIGHHIQSQKKTEIL